MPLLLLKSESPFVFSVSVCSVYSVVKQPVLKLGYPSTFVHYPKVGILEFYVSSTSLPAASLAGFGSNNKNFYCPHRTPSIFIDLKNTNSV